MHYDCSINRDIQLLARNAFVRRQQGHFSGSVCQSNSVYSPPRRRLLPRRHRHCSSRRRGPHPLPGGEQDSFIDAWFSDIFKETFVQKF